MRALLPYIPVISAVEGQALGTLDTVLQRALDNARQSTLGAVLGPR